MKKNDMENMTYEMAVTAMKENKKVTRAGWNGKARNMVMFTTAQYPDTNSKMGNPYFYMSVDGTCTPWHPSNLDMFTNDWSIVE